MQWKVLRGHSGDATCWVNSVHETVKSSAGILGLFSNSSFLEGGSPLSPQPWMEIYECRPGWRTEVGVGRGALRPLGRAVHTSFRRSRLGLRTQDYWSSHLQPLQVSVTE